MTYAARGDRDAVLAIAVRTAVFMLALAPGLRSQAASTGITWVASFDSAAMEASASNRLILVHFNRATDEASQSIVTQALMDPAVLKLAKKFVWVVGSPDVHEAAGKDQSCARFPGTRCKDHQASWTQTSQAVSKSPNPTPAQFVFLRPDRSLIFRRIGMTNGAELAGQMQLALDSVADADKAGTVAPEKLKALFEAANANRDTIRKPAIRELARIDDPRALKLLAEQFKPEAGEVKRQEAIKATKDAKNLNALTLIIPLLGDASGQLRRNAVFALRNLGVVEGVEPMITCYLRENTDRMRALILRTIAKMDKDHAKMLQIHQTNLTTGGPLMRTHALLACLDIDISPEQLDLIIEIAEKGTCLTVQAVACYVATEIILRAKTPVYERSIPGAAGTTDGYSRTVARPNSKEFIALQPKLGDKLRRLADQARDLALREYAKTCVEALDGKSNRFRTDIKHFHDDAKDEVFKEY